MAMALPGLRRKPETWDQINARKAAAVGAGLDAMSDRAEADSAPSVIRALNPVIGAPAAPVDVASLRARPGPRRVTISDEVNRYRTPVEMYPGSSRRGTAGMVPPSAISPNLAAVLPVSQLAATGQAPDLQAVRNANAAPLRRPPQFGPEVDPLGATGMQEQRQAAAARGIAWGERHIP
jgi:hypothetical protein